MIENLDVTADGVLHRAFEVDPPFLGYLQPRLGLQDVDGDTRAALHPLVFQIELDLDGFLVGARQIDQTALPEDVGVDRNALEKRVLTGALQGDVGDGPVEPRRLHRRRRCVAVEQVLGYGQADDVARAYPWLGIELFSALGRGVDDFGATIGGRRHGRIKVGQRLVDFLAGGFGGLRGGLNLRVIRKKPHQFAVQ